MAGLGSGLETIQESLQPSSSSPGLEAPGLDELQVHMAELRTRVDSISRELHELQHRCKQHKLGSGGAENTDSDNGPREGVSVGEEMCGEFAVQLADVKAKLVLDLQTEITQRLVKSEKSMIASMRDSLTVGFQTALEGLTGHVSKLQTTHSELKKVSTRLDVVEINAADTKKQVKDLASKISALSSTDVDDGAKTMTPMQSCRTISEKVEPVILKTSPLLQSTLIKAPGLVDTLANSTESTATEFDAHSDVAVSMHNGSEDSHRGGASSKAASETSASLENTFRDNLAQTLARLTQSIDHTLRAPSLSPGPSMRVVAPLPLVRVLRSPSPRARSPNVDKTSIQADDMSITYGSAEFPLTPRDRPRTPCLSARGGTPGAPHVAKVLSSSFSLIVPPTVSGADNPHGVQRQSSRPQQKVISQEAQRPGPAQGVTRPAPAMTKSSVAARVMSVPVNLRGGTPQQRHRTEVTGILRVAAQSRERQ